MDINALIEHLTDQRDRHGNKEVMIVDGQGTAYEIHGLELDITEGDLMIVMDD